jgi:NADPH:quinone reductase-like Zn-dependent oxidoreductase
LGAEGCGVIDRVGSKLDEAALVGKKVAFTYGSWSNFVIKDFYDVIVFDNQDVDARIISRSFVNSMTALCLLDRVKSMILDKQKLEKSFQQSQGQISQSRKPLVFFLGAESHLGCVFLNLCSRANSVIFDLAPVFRSKESFDQRQLKFGKALYLDCSKFSQAKEVTQESNIAECGEFPEE